MWLPTCLAVLSIENSKTVRNSNYLETHSLGKLSIIFMLHPLNKEISEMPWLSLNRCCCCCLKKKHNMQCPQTLFWKPTDRTHLKCAGHFCTLPPKRTLLTHYFMAVNYTKNFSQKDWIPYFDLDRYWLVALGYANNRLCL